MNEQDLKTTPKQRAIILIVAFLLLFSTIAAYVAIVLSSGKSSDGLSAEDQATVTELETSYTAKQQEINARATTLSGTYFKEFSGYKSRVKSYNAANINTTGLKTEDLKTGSGRTLESGDTNYYAYYIGWCADETVFDSSFDSFDNPTTLSAPISAQLGLIEGWNKGVVGMRIGGVREIAVPGELAYGESQEICGTTNSPLKFIVMAVEDETLTKLDAELQELYAQLVNIYYGN